MAKQKNAAAGHSGGDGGRNREGSTAAHGRASDSATPAPLLKLRLKLGGQGKQELQSDQDFSQELNVSDDEERECEEGQQEADEPTEGVRSSPQSPVQTTRAGRATTKPQRYVESVLEDEIDQRLVSSAVKVDGDEAFQPSSPRKYTS
jgi:hypothetical protein